MVSQVDEEISNVDQKLTAIHIVRNNHKPMPVPPDAVEKGEGSKLHDI